MLRRGQNTKWWWSDIENAVYLGRHMRAIFTPNIPTYATYIFEMPLHFYALFRRGDDIIDEFPTCLRYITLPAGGEVYYRAFKWTLCARFQFRNRMSAGARGLFALAAILPALFTEEDAMICTTNTDLCAAGNINYRNTPLIDFWHYTGAKSCRQRRWYVWKSHFFCLLRKFLHLCI